MDQHLKVAVLEQDNDAGQSDVALFSHHPHVLIHVSDCEELDELMAKTDIQTVVIGCNISVDTCVTLVKRLRATRPNLVIILLINTDSQDLRIQGYKSGADVCISGALSTRELGAVIDSISQRIHANSVTKTRVRLDCHRRELTGTAVVALNVVELTLLKALAQAPDRQMAYFRLLELFDTEVDSKAKAALEVHITRLRKKLVDAGAQSPAIRAIRNEGYQLIEPIRIA